MKNIIYKSTNIADYFSNHRIKWDQFYESERKIISQLSPSEGNTVLDIGCGCGGLGLALKDKFKIIYYTGVEVNHEAAEAARRLNPSANIYQGDILDLYNQNLTGKLYDLVFSLSCIDWNVEFSSMLKVAWSLVSEGGFLIATFRLTDETGCRDISRSYQYINYEGVRIGEKASYIVLSPNELIRELKQPDAANINVFGYWGKPSQTAVTPYKNLCFVACSVQKRASDNKQPLTFNLELPLDISEKIEKIL